MRPNHQFRPTNRPARLRRSVRFAGELGRWDKLAVAHFLMLAIGASAS
jgi:hypothetical protein